MFQNLDSIFISSILSNHFKNLSYHFLRENYCHLIHFFRDNQIPFTIKDSDLEYLHKHTSSLQLHVLIRLMTLFRSQDNQTENQQMLWVNKLRFKIKNNNHTQILNLLNRYLGMGHDHALLYIENKEQFWLDYQGGSNGYEYDDNLQRLIKEGIETIPKMSLTQALKKLFKYR